MSNYKLIALGSRTLPPALQAAVDEARAQCPGVDEEEGGLILVKDDVYKFVKLRNKHTGETVAVGFIEFDPAEYGEKIISLFNDGWRNHSSFHTHPTGCRALPSMIDLTRLFNGFPVNYIWSPSREELSEFTYAGVCLEDGKTAWDYRGVLLD